MMQKLQIFLHKQEKSGSDDAKSKNLEVTGTIPQKKALTHSQNSKKV
jgi:hypothetical protein